MSPREFSCAVEGFHERLKDARRQAWLIGLYVGQAFAGQLKPFDGDPAPAAASGHRSTLQALAEKMGTRLRPLDPNTKVIQGLVH